MAIFAGGKTSDFNLIVDISSGSVGAALILKNPKYQPLVLATSRKNFTSEAKGDRLLSGMLNALDHACADIQKKTGRKPDKIFCVVGTPWSFGQLRSIKYDSKEDFKFTEKFAKRLLDEEVEKFKGEWRNLPEIIDKRTTQVLLNGYSVNKPHGQTARSVRLDVFVSLAESENITKIEEKIHKTFKARIAFTSQMFSDFIVVRDVFDIRNDFIILNVSDEVTEVSIMKDDHLVGTAFFPYGVSSMVRTIADDLGKSPGETESLFNIHNEQLLDYAANKRFIEAVKSAGSIWLAELKNILNTLVQNRHLPRNVFLNAGSAHISWFSSRLSRTFFPEFTTSHEDFNVIMGSNNVLHGFCDYAENVYKDPQLTMKSIFINHL